MSSEERTGVCTKCNQPHQYQWKGTPRAVCDGCKKAARVAAAKRDRDNIKRVEGEANYYEGLSSIACMSQQEAAQKLALWEALEKVAAGDRATFVHLTSGTIDTVLEPISKAAVQQLERRAIMKIRKALQPYWNEFRKGAAQYA